MRFTATELDGVIIVDLARQRDDRGFFARSFCEDEFSQYGLSARFPQSNLSHNTTRGTVRGMHHEVLPSEESKLVRCGVGSVYDVVVDLRPTSPTCHRWTAIELSRANGRAVFIPPGCAHGFLTLTDDVDVWYQMGSSFRQTTAQGFRWNDPFFGITWPMTPNVVSARDAMYPDFVPG